MLTTFQLSDQMVKESNQKVRPGDTLVTTGPVLHERQARSHYDFRSHDFRVWGFRVSGLGDHEGDNNNGDLDDADATCQDPHDTDSIFETDNTVSAGTPDFFQEKVKSMDVHIYSTWPTLWSRSPHPICSGDVLKHVCVCVCVCVCIHMYVCVYIF